MKIETGIKSLTSGTLPEEPLRAPRKAEADSSTAAAVSTIQLSNTAAHLQAIEKGFADTPVIDSARVAELKQAIAAGHFKVNADKVADGLIETVRELLRTHKA